ncbi:MAG: DUF305 domain-containing protein [Chloroflexi bacterium]|nr:DUF305 domain-containing protein [Chloroflexota bacterium]
MPSRVHGRFAALLAVVVAAVPVVGCGGSSGTDSSAKANDVDRAFVAEMIPHHQMAVEMSSTAGQSARHPQIKALASSITSSQRREIAEMKSVAGDLGVKPDAMQMDGGMKGDMGTMSRNSSKLGIAMDQMGMMMNMSSLDGAKPFDRKFIDMMIPHHAGAIRMARAELAKGKSPKLRALSRTIVAHQTAEIQKMNSWRTGWFGGPSPAGGVPKG